MPILHVSKTYIHFLHGKMGRKISEGNTADVAAKKSPFGIRILFNKTDVFYHCTSLFILIENVIDNT